MRRVGQGADVAEAACAAIEPDDGRNWLSIGERIFVFSGFLGGKIAAWSIYEPGFAISDFAEADDRLYARSGDTIYLYGGADGDTYPGDGEQTVTVQTPFISAYKPNSEKDWPAIALALENEWTVTVSPDPRDDTKTVAIGTFDGVTFNSQKAGMDIVGTHLALNLTCTKGGAASIAAVALDFMRPRDDRI